MKVDADVIIGALGAIAGAVVAIGTMLINNRRSRADVTGVRIKSNEMAIDLVNKAMESVKLISIENASLRSENMRLKQLLADHQIEVPNV